jgi:ubiquinone/menaquinone biosynthesis C-methylase UbiE
MNYGTLYDEQVAETYDKDEYGLLRGVRSLAISQILEFRLPQASTVLDLGAGTGESLAALRDHLPRGRFIGVDLSAKMLEIATRKIALETHVADACDAGAHIPAGSADLVIAHFLTSFVDRRRLFDVARRALRPEGVLSVASTTREAMVGLRTAVESLLGDQALIDAAVPSPSSGDEMADELRQCGFTVSAVQRFSKRLAWKSFDECLEWGLTSGFLTQAVDVIGAERVNDLRAAAGGFFPLEDEYVGVAISAVATHAARP